jgi:hypothetical protein
VICASDIPEVMAWSGTIWTGRLTEIIAGPAILLPTGEQAPRVTVPDKPMLYRPGYCHRIHCTPADTQWHQQCEMIQSLRIGLLV